MDANKIRLLEFVGSSKRTFNIPVYQRNYDWKFEHCTKLFNDIENIVAQDYRYEHFIGTIVYVVSSIRPNFTEYVLIDGQQRITSISLLLKALHEAVTDVKLKEEIYEEYLINKRAPEELRVKLKPIESDNIAYKNLVISADTSTDSNIVKNFKLFKELIVESKYEAQEIYEALNYIELVYIALEKEKKSENPQLIFESLNSTGLSLTESDLIRNFLLMNNSYDEQKRLYEDYWLKIEKLLTNAKISDFVRDYLTMKTGTIPKKTNVYNAFKDYYKTNNKNYDEEGYLVELLAYAKYYSWFLCCNSPNKNINNLLKQIQILKSTVVYPPLLWLFEDCFEFKSITEKELLDTLHIFITYIFRRQICDYPTNALNKIFASLIAELENKTGADVSLRVLKALTSKTSSGTFPRDDEFKRKFISKDLYKSKIDKYTLFTLETFINKKEVIDLTQEITIEHIMPQKLSPKWQLELGDKANEIHVEYLHTIGNLTLTGANSELSNKSFSDKKNILINSNISIGRNLKNYDDWNRESIERRACELFDLAKEVWFLPEVYSLKKTNSDALDYNQLFNIYDDIIATGEKPKQLVIDDVAFPITTWKEMLRQLCRYMYDIDSQGFRALIYNDDFKGRDKKTIDSTSELMNSPYEIAEDLYIETNLSANSIINYCRLICDNFSVQDDVYFKLQRKR